MLPADRSAVLKAIVEGQLAWSSASQIAATTGAQPASVEAALVELQKDGWVETWEREDGDVVLLSAWGAEQLGVRPVEDEGLSFRWQSIDCDEPRERASRSVPLDVEPVDQAAEVLDQIIADEEAEAQRWEAWAGDVEAFYLDPPKRRKKLSARAGRGLLLGSTGPFPDSLLLSDGQCPHCHGVLLPSGIDCLACIERGEWELRQAKMWRSRHEKPLPRRVMRQCKQDLRLLEPLRREREKAKRAAKWMRRRKAS